MHNQPRLPVLLGILIQKNTEELMTIIIPILIGILGSTLMYLGDMLLYFSRDGYNPHNPVESLFSIMSRIKKIRLYAGGMLGPFAGFLCALGSLHVFTMSDNSQFELGFFITCINALGAVVGGAYHVQCAYIGITGRLSDTEAFHETIRFLKIQKIGLIIIMGLGGIGISLYIALGCTLAPQWVALFTPAVLVLLLPMLRKIPGPIGIAIAGGWFNLVYIIYYLVLLFVL